MLSDTILVFCYLLVEYASCPDIASRPAPPSKKIASFGLSLWSWDRARGAGQVLFMRCRACSQAGPLAAAKALQSPSHHNGIDVAHDHRGHAR
jgi:hypothetical protein